MLNKVKSSDLYTSKLVKLELPIRTELDLNKLSQTTQIFMAMGSEDVGITMNGALVAVVLWSIYNIHSNEFKTYRN